MTWTLANLLQSVKEVKTEINGKWIPCRPRNYRFLMVRIKSAWLVLTGKADAVIWPEGQ